MAFLNLVAVPSSGPISETTAPPTGKSAEVSRWVKAEPAAQAGSKYRRLGARVSTLLAGGIRGTEASAKIRPPAGHAASIGRSPNLRRDVPLLLHDAGP